MKKQWLFAVFLTLGLASNAHSIGYSFTTIDYPSNSYIQIESTVASGINDRGEIVGTYAGTAGVLNPASVRYGYLYSNNAFVDIYGYGMTSLSDINNSGVVAGSYTRGGEYPNSITLGFTAEPGPNGFYNEPVPYIPPLPRAHNASLGGINDAGHVAGPYEIDEEDTAGFVYNGSSYVKIYEGLETFVRDINNNDQVVGTYWAEDQQPVGFLWDGQGPVSTVSFPGAWSTETYALNDLGVIAGAYNLLVDEYLIGPDQGFVYDGEYHAVNFPGAESTAVLGINNAGYLVGSYSSNGMTHGFLAVPTSGNGGGTAVPEPAVAALLGVGFAGVAAVRLLRRERDKEARMA